MTIIAATIETPMSLEAASPYHLTHKAKVEEAIRRVVRDNKVELKDLVLREIPSGIGQKLITEIVIDKNHEIGRSMDPFEKRNPYTTEITKAQLESYHREIHRKDEELRAKNQVIHDLTHSIRLEKATVEGKAPLVWPWLVAVLVCLWLTMSIWALGAAWQFVIAMLFTTIVPVYIMADTYDKKKEM